jgi:hypothetical protein
MLDLKRGFLGWLKQTPPVIFLGIAMASGIVLIVGDDLASTIGLAEFRKEYRAFLNGALVLSLALVVAHGLWSGGKGIVAHLKRPRARRDEGPPLEIRQEQLHQLTPDEKAYLAPYIFGKESTRHFKMEDSTAGGLVAKSILYRSSHIGSMTDGWAHTLRPWARNYLEANPQLLDGASGKRKQGSGRT